MTRYSFVFEGELVVDAESEEEAREMADELLATSAWVADHCVDHSIYEIELTDEEELDDEDDDEAENDHIEQQLRKKSEVIKMLIVIDIDDDTYRYMQSRCQYQNKGDKGLSKFEEAGVAIKNGIVFPSNPTNGDIINVLFPNEYDFETDFDEKWWNTPYGGNTE